MRPIPDGREGIGMRESWVLIAVAVSTLCAGCSGERGWSSAEDGNCTSHYVQLATAPTWAGLKDAMLASEEWGRAVAVRTQARGEDVGAGDREAVRVVDLLNSKGRRLIQADVWRTDTGTWHAGVWHQCID